VSSNVVWPYVDVVPYRTWELDGISVVQVTVVEVEVMPVLATFDRLGGLLDGAGVVTGARFDGGETFPAASKASTV
jgi:hypothetical protein